MPAHRQRGFTLIELLVALFITAIMFAFGYRALDQAFRSRREVDEQSARLIAVQQAMRTLEQDIELLAPRPVRNLIGDGYLPAVSAAQNNTIGSLGTTLGGSSASGFSSGFSTGFGSASSVNGSSTPLLTFTRGGWTNPAGIQRSELQRVSYSIENGALMRLYYPVLDATEAVQPVKRQLIDHVKNFSLRFMDAGHNWQNGWPPITSGAGAAMVTPRLRPVAVEVTIELDDWGVLVRHIEVAG
ncbi:MAG TPA: type II secretion system minor pseudopilin GspJ [Steroidobacteraceae bacterium]|jgi:general secretion pathway protein J|nr:type II secretion system minor pseudopilin GspJ [Steroidobacteraceae bacterium]